MAIDIIKEASVHRYTFTLWPQQWATYSNSHDWQHAKLDDAERGDVPDSPGIYTLLTLPGIAGHPSCSYLMYVGQTTSLRRRFGEYLGKERAESGRPKMSLFLNQYSEHIWFFFTRVETSNLEDVETKLRDAYVPPLNERFSGRISKVMGAF